MSGTGPKPKVLKKGVTFKQGAPNVKAFQPENAPAVLGQGTRRKTKPKACGPRGQRPVAENTNSVESASSSERNQNSELNELSSVATNELESTVNGSEEENNGSSVASENLESVFSNSNSNSTVASNGSEENEEDLQSLVSGPVNPIAGNPNLPSILFIGEGTVAEQLHLGKGSIQTMGGFNTHTLGDYKELQRLYGVTTPEEVEALQLAFGVSSLTKRSPPLKLAIEANCKMPYFPLVITLLANRVRSLQTSLNAMPNGLQKRGKVAFAKWLEDTIRTLKSIQTPCPATLSTAQATPVYLGDESGSEDSDSVGSANTAERKTGSGSCNCLQDINLLRDLVYVVALLQGSTSPEVQAQIDRIGLQDILELAEGGDTEEALEGLKVALEALKDVPDTVKAGSADQKFLNELYSKLTGTETAVDARKGDVIQEIDDLINLYPESTRDHETDVKELEAEKAGLKARLAEIEATGTNKNAEISDLEEEINELDGLLTESEQEKASLLLQIPALTEQLRVALKGKSASNTTASTLEAQLEQLREQIASTSLEAFGAQATLRSATKAHAEQIAGLKADHARQLADVITKTKAMIQKLADSGELDEAELGELKDPLETLQTFMTAVGEKEAELGELRAQITALQAEPAALRTRLEEVSAELARLQAKEATNKNIDDANIALLAERMAKIVSLGAELKAVTTNRNAKATELDRLKGVETQLADKTAELARLTETYENEKIKSTRDLTAKNTALSASRKQLEACETKSETDSAELAKLGPLQAQVVALQAEIDALTSRGATATADFTRAKRELEDQMTALRTATNGELAGLKEQKNIEIGRLQKELTARNATIAEMERILTSKNAELTGIQAKANANVKSARNTATASVEEAERKAKDDVEALTKQLADEKAAKAELEGRLRELPTPSALAMKEELLKKQTEMIARLSAELEARPKTDRLEELEGQLKAMRASLEGKELLTPEEITKLQTHYLATYKAGADEYITGMLASHKAELEARNVKIAELEKKPSAESLAELQGVLAEAKAESTTRIEELEAKIAELESAKAPDTEERLNTLLGALILDDQLRESAKTFMTTGEQSDLKTASKEMCEFFIYLKNVITLQMIEVNSTLAGYPNQQKDILQIFKKPPTFTKEENKQLLSEITAMFQEIFVESAKTTYPPAFELTGSYPTLSNLLTYDISDDRPLMYYTSQDQSKLTTLITSLKTLQIMNQYGIEPRKDSKLYLQQASKLPTEPFIVFSQQNKSHYTPIVIFAIKMFQLLKENLNERTLKLKTICGL